MPFSKIQTLSKVGRSRFWAWMFCLMQQWQMWMLEDRSVWERQPMAGLNSPHRGKADLKAEHSGSSTSKKEGFDSCVGESSDSSWRHSDQSERVRGALRPWRGSDHWLWPQDLRRSAPENLKVTVGLKNKWTLSLKPNMNPPQWREQLLPKPPKKDLWLLRWMQGAGSSNLICTVIGQV